MDYPESESNKQNQIYIEYFIVGGAKKSPIFHLLAFISSRVWQNFKIFLHFGLWLKAEISWEFDAECLSKKNPKQCCGVMALDCTHFSN